MESIFAALSQRFPDLEVQEAHTKYLHRAIIRRVSGSFSMSEASAFISVVLSESSYLIERTEWIWPADGEALTVNLMAFVRQRTV